MRIEGLERVDDGLLVSVEGQARRLFTWRWLLDHSDDPGSLNATTKQRMVDTFEIAADICPASVELDQDGSLLRLTWVDPDRETTCSSGLFHGVVAEQPAAEPVLWSTPDSLLEHPVFAYADVLADDSALLAWMGQVQRVGFGIVQALPPTEDAATALAERIATPRSTVFGGMWRLASEMRDHQDSAYTTTFIEPHTDSTYMTDAPGTQMFCCLERTGTGGESILVDAFAIAESMRSTDPDAFKTLTTVEVPGRYLEPGVHLRATRPPVRLDRDGNIVQVSFNNYDRAPFWLPEPQMGDFYDAYRVFHDHVMDESGWFELRLTPGDALIFDNWRLLHGRRAYSGRRVFYGCYHNRDDFLSRLAVL